MNRIMRWTGVGLVLVLGLGVARVQAQQRSAAAEPQTPDRAVRVPHEIVPALPVPRLVKFAGVSKDEQGNPRNGVVGVTLAIYKEQEGGAALWVETQNVELDEQGRYTVLLGATKSEGLPLELFATGEPRWLGVQVNVAKEVEQPRVFLVSVPYALKAADAETLGGKPLSSFVLATPQSGGVVGVGTALNAATGAILPATIGGGGTQNFVAKFDATGVNVINSSLFDNGQVGIGTTTPGALLDVQLTTGAAANALNSKVTLNNSSPITGSVLSAFKMTLLDQSTATNLSKQPARFQYLRDVTATGGVTAFDAVMTATSFLNSNAPYPLRGVNIEGPTMATGTTLANFTGLYIGSGGGAGAVTTRFALVTEPGAGNVGLGTIAPSQKLEVAGSLKISGGGNALVFPDGTVMTSAGAGTNGGTITGVTAGTGLTGGGTAGGVTLNIASGGITNALLGANSVTNANIADGSLSPAKITGGSFATLGANTFLGNQSVVAMASGVTGLSVQTTDLASANTAVNGLADGAGGTGVIGEAENGSLAIGVWGISSSGVAGQFSGNVNVTGSLSKAGGSFKIDHPADPANKYLYHSFVESPDMKNIYDGVTNLDAQGEAVVQLPAWFGVLNKEFRYQLTCIGGFAPVYIAEEISENHFKIAGGKPGMKISWMVTGIRQDAWANAHRIPVEEEKPVQERGYYLHPELYGQPPQKSTEWATHQEVMTKKEQNPVKAVEPKR
jgi:hypothetical protein